LLSIDTTRQAVAERILVPGAIEMRHIAEAPTALGSYLLIPLMQPKNLGPLIQVSQGWMMTHGIAVVRPDLRSPLGEAQSKVTQVVMDDIDYYYATNSGVAFTADGRRALVTSADADTVSILDTARFAQRLRQIPTEELATRLDSAVTFVVKRLPTGHNPTSVTVSLDSRRAYVTNRLDDSITVVDVAQAKIEGTIDLGGPKEITLRRRGEQMFHDARVCYQGQFACATCHPNSHLDGLAWNIETPQLGRDRVANRTLRGIRETAPYKWNGHNADLATQCGPRIAKYFFRSEGFNKQDLDALLTYLNDIPLAPNRHLAADGQLTEAQERGKAIFFRTKTSGGKTIPLHDRCDTCHPPDTHYTARYSTNVGSATKYDTSGLFDIPQLDRVYEDGPYLHDGEAMTLEEIWTVFNNDDKHGITSDMSKQQLNDLIEYLKTL
jgi:hypothetical protein